MLFIFFPSKSTARKACLTEAVCREAFNSLDKNKASGWHLLLLLLLLYLLVIFRICFCCFCCLELLYPFVVVVVAGVVVVAVV